MNNIKNSLNSLHNLNNLDYNLKLMNKLILGHNI